MKRYIGSVLAAVALAATPALAASAPDAADKVASKMLEMTRTTDAMKAHIDSVLNSLSSLTGEGGDLVAKYKAFGKDVDKTESMYKKAKSKGAKVRSQRESYLKKWESSQGKIQNEELRKASQSRKGELMPIIDKLKESVSGAEQTFLPFLQDLKDINLFLGNNLTSSGIGSVKQTLVPKCTADGATLKAKLDEAAGALKELAAKIQPSQGSAS